MTDPVCRKRFGFNTHTHKTQLHCQNALVWAHRENRTEEGAVAERQAWDKAAVSSPPRRDMNWNSKDHNEIALNRIWVEHVRSAWLPMLPSSVPPARCSPPCRAQHDRMHECKTGLTMECRRDAYIHRLTRNRKTQSQKQSTPATRFHPLS